MRGDIVAVEWLDVTGDGSSHDGCDGVGLGCCVRRPAGEQRPEGGGEGVDVRWGSAGLAIEAFRCRVRGGHHRQPGGGVGAEDRAAGDAEVAQHGLVVGVEEDVRGFDVAVDHLVGVRDVERAGQRNCEPRDLGEGQRALVAYA